MLRQLSGVKSIDSTTVDGWNRIRVETDGQDVREAVASSAAKHNWPLRELRLEVGSLEEYFVQITAEAMAEQKRNRATAAA